jgi:hypothetical protein
MRFLRQSTSAEAQIAANRPRSYSQIRAAWIVAARNPLAGVTAKILPSTEDRRHVMPPRKRQIASSDQPVDNARRDTPISQFDQLAHVTPLQLKYQPSASPRKKESKKPVVVPLRSQTRRQNQFSHYF